MGKEAARDIVSVRAVADKLWPQFCAPIIDGTYGTRDFSKLLIARRTLFQGETALIDGLVVERPAKAGQQQQSRQEKGVTHQSQMPVRQRAASKFSLFQEYVRASNLLG